MTMHADPVERLRAERPDATTDPTLLAPATPRLRSESVDRRRRRPRRIQVLVAGAAAIAIVLTGAISLRDGSDGRRGFERGISVAEAREQAIDALRGVGRLKDYTYTSSYAIEDPDDGRRYESSWTNTLIDGDSQLSSWNRNDFAGIEQRDGIEKRVVDGYRYESRGNTRNIEKPWILDVRNGWPEPGGRRPFAGGWTFGGQPKFDVLLAQLEREGLIDARRDEDGNVVVEIKRPAKELAPITASITGDDPISMFAMGVARMGPDRLVTVRMTIGKDGALRTVRSSGTYPTTVANGNGGLELDARIVSTQTWAPRSKPIPAPDASDVMVVGDAMQARKGVTGPRGQLGTLDTLDVDDLRRLRSEAKRTKVPPRVINRPTRSYPRYFQRRSQEQRLFRTTMAKMMPFDREAFATDPDCVPLWPDSRRAMDPAIASDAPTKAGWRCEVDELGTIVVMPEPSGLIEWQPPSGGVVGFGRQGYRPRT